MTVAQPGSGQAMTGGGTMQSDSSRVIRLENGMTRVRGSSSPRERCSV